MQLVLNAEQQDLRAGVRKFLIDRSGSAQVRSAMAGEAGFDRALWNRLTAELGLAGLVVPGRYGGAGAGHVERAVVLEELGRALTPSPYLASAVLAVDTLLALDDEEARVELLPGLTSGELIGTVAIAERSGAWNASALVATRAGDGWVLDGHKSFVIAGAVADVLLVLAATPDGPGWFRLDATAAGVARRSLRTLDPTRRLARIDFTGAAARPLASRDPGAARALVRDLFTVALAAEQLGVLQRACEMAVDYAKVRVQFGRTIGSYQAVKHACADMYAAAEQATSALRFAAWTADADQVQLPIAAALASAYLAPAAFDVAGKALQLHGGVGYTWEHDAHLYFKRAKSSELLLGTNEQRWLHLADQLDGEA